MSYFKSKPVRIIIICLIFVFLFILIMPKSVNIADTLHVYKYTRPYQVTDIYDYTDAYDLTADSTVEFSIIGEIKNNIFLGEIIIDEKLFQNISIDLRRQTPTLYEYQGSKRLIYGFLEQIKGNFNSFALVINNDSVPEREILLYNLSVEEYIANNTLE